MNEIFVYGSLVGEKEDARKAVLKGFEKDESAKYPTIVPSDESVEGEIILVSDEQLQEMDEYERFYLDRPEDSLYWRKKIDGVWTYIGNPEEAERYWDNGSWDTEYTEEDVEEGIEKAELVRLQE